MNGVPEDVPLTEPGVHTFPVRDGDRIVEATLIVWPDGKSAHFSVPDAEDHDG